MSFEKIINPFAESGTRGVIPQVSPIDGSISFTTGYGPNYDLAIGTTGALAIERDTFNQLQNTVTGNIQYWQENTYPLYVTPADNGGTAVTYSFGARVRFDDGTNGERVYEVINTSGADTVPTTAGDWIVGTTSTVNNRLIQSAQTTGSITLTGALTGAPLPRGVPLYFTPTTNIGNSLNSAVVTLQRSGFTDATETINFSLFSGFTYALIADTGAIGFSIIPVDNRSVQSSTGRRTPIGLRNAGGSVSIPATAAFASVSPVNGDFFAVLTSAGATAGALQAYRLNGSTPAAIGTPLPLTGGLSMSRIGASTVAAVVGGELEAYFFNSASWSQLGNSLSVGGSGSVSDITTLSDTRIAVYLSDSSQIRIYDFNNTDFSLFASVVVTDTGRGSLAALSEDTFVFYGNSSDSLRSYEITGTNIVETSTTTITRPTNALTTVSALNSTDFALTVDGASVDNIDFYRYSGNSLDRISRSAPISQEVGIFSCVTQDEFIIVDVTNNNLQAYDIRYQFGATPPSIA